MDIKLFYEKTYEYLVEKAKNNNVNEEKLQEYFTPKTGNGEIFRKRPEKTLNNLLFRLAFHTQNSGQKKNVIKFPTTNSEDDTTRENLFSEIFCNYDPANILETYKNVDELFNKFICDLGYEKLSKKSKTGDHKKSIPYKYCNSIYSSASFLLQFESYDEVISKLKSLGEFSPIYLSYELPEFGIALACDFIKELDEDFNDFPKPDTHILEFLFDLGLINKKSGDEAKYKAIKKMKELVDDIKQFDNSMTSYKLDKIIWLISTEYFYNDNGTKNSGKAKRNAFVKYIKNICKI